VSLPPPDAAPAVAIPRRARVPVYAVLFRMTSLSGRYRPLVASPYGADAQITGPHGFDREVAAALPGLWYCLHLPNTVFELSDVPAPMLKGAQRLDLPHHIVPVPVDALNAPHLAAKGLGVPMLAVCPDELLDEATSRCNELGFALPPAAFSQLSDATLAGHWQAIHTVLGGDDAYLGYEPVLTRRLDLAPINLPLRWLSRQFRHRPDPEDVDAPVARALYSHAMLAATARLERQDATEEEAARTFPNVAAEERARLRIPVVLAVPGVAPRYTRVAYEPVVRERMEPLPATDPTDTWSPTIAERRDALVERAAIEFAATHRALARGGVGLMLPSLPPEAFTILAELEGHMRGAAPRGRAVWKLLDRLSSATSDVWTEAVVDLVQHASMLTVFSNFPVGLMRLPGDTSPLCARVPITYRPLLPLTHTVQAELLNPLGLDWSSGLRVLVAECIPQEDPVGAASRKGWTFARDNLGAGLSIELVETLAVDALRTAIEQQQPDVLVISAHGVLTNDRAVAGLQIGDDLVLGPGLEPLPRVVILSACHVAPRGASTVSVTDLLLREGADAVLGTQVPVDVRHNAILMVRFLVNIAAVRAGEPGGPTLLDVWHHVQRSNAVNDVLHGTPALEQWGRTPTASSSAVVQQFMAKRSAGRVRVGHIYNDTEQVLGEIADEQGCGARVRGWFKQPGYVPESLFYVFAGRPERVHLRAPDEAFA
jgi:CHAT domain